MSFKPSRGTLIFNKAIEKSHECYFKYWELTDIKQKSKVFFQMIKADEIIGTTINKNLSNYKCEVDVFKQNLNIIYKPLLKILQNV